MTETLFMTTKEAAQFLCLSPKTLERYRTDGYGPPFHKHGRRVLYLKSELEKWSAGKTYSSSSEYPNGSHSPAFVVSFERHFLRESEGSH